jgi:sterol desaturase/sphingolipid hydroxylase (fatty acid hydroxylase superfamily)/uncharacterized membrane protein YhhN
MTVMSKVIVLATPVFLLLMAVEYLWGRTKGRNTYRLDDTVNSVSLGVLSQLSGAFLKLFTLGLYTAVFEHAALGSAPELWASPAGWLLALVLYDFCYYWLHRGGHECAVLWAAHVVHHQSQHYNLSTALRQTSTGALLGWVFYMPMALIGVPPLLFAIVALVDLLYQFWIHTEHVPRLGWFDRVFASPSNHRVHHAVNDEYLDKNYGGILIVWDRIFGTFREETEPCVYGTRSPLNSWDPLWANAEVYWGLLRDSLRARGLGNKLGIWLKAPGWRPAELAKRDPRPVFELKQVKPFHPQVPQGVKIFCAAQFVALLGAGAGFLWHVDAMPNTQALAWVAALALAFWSLGAAIQGRLHVLAVLMLESAVLSTLSASEQWLTLHHLFKPLTLMLALVWTLRRAAPPARPHDVAMLAALAACLAGDVFLMLPGLFIPGLGAFLLAHLCYGARWGRDAPWLASRAALLGTTATGAAMLAYLWPHLDAALKAPVAIYVLAISLMAAQALGRATVLRTAKAWGVAAGALAFMASDSLLAVNRFVSPVPMAEMAVLSTYYIAQVLMVLNASTTQPAGGTGQDEKRSPALFGGVTPR